MTISGIEKRTRVLRIPSTLDGDALEIILNEDFDNLSKGYEYLIGLGVRVHNCRVQLESNPELESKVRNEFQEMIEKLSDTEATFKEVKKIPTEKIEGFKMLFTLEEERRYNKKSSI